MNNVIGSVNRLPGGTSVVPVDDISWTPIVFTGLDDVNNVGLLSNNDGTLINNSGGTVELNGSLMMFAVLSAAGIDLQLVVGLSPDGVAWTPEDPSYEDTYQRIPTGASGGFEYKVDVPDGYHVAILGKTLSGSANLNIYTARHQVYSTQGEIVPTLNAVCSMTLDDGTYLKNTFGGYTLTSLPTTESSEAVGATTASGRITNTSGQTLVVDGKMHFVCQGSLLAGFNIHYAYYPFKNGVAIPNAVWVRTLTAISNTSAVGLYLEYTVELDPGEYVDLYDRNLSGGIFAMYYRYFQHTMRSRT